ISAAAHSLGGTDESEQLRDGAAALCEPGGDRADAECLVGIRIADAGDGGGSVGAREGRWGRIAASQGRQSIE
ncbi:MAG: hypothetical protein QHJ82_10585, partial [Verrucomicrobiota bacterium]|nr:hypothetical protein [Verrucomicrobiota bacterium]